MHPRWFDREQLIHQVVTYARDGLSRRAISRALRISRNTVKKILRNHSRMRKEPHTALPAPPARAPREKKIDAYQAQVQGLLDKYDGSGRDAVGRQVITAQRVFEILKDNGYDGGYTAVKELVRQLRPKPKRKPSLPTPDWGPGKMAESDWSPYELRLINGRRLKVQVFAYVLSQSKRKYGSSSETGLHDLARLRWSGE